MGVKRQHTLEIHSSERHLDQYVPSFEHNIFVMNIRNGYLPEEVTEYLDTNFPDDDWDWHFKIVGAVLDECSLHNRNNLDLDIYVSFRSKEHAFYFWWWVEQQDFQ